MKKILAIFAFFFSLGIHESIRAASIQEAMFEDLNAIKYHMEIQYAPKEWKRELFGWSIESAYQEAAARICDLDKPTVKDYQGVLANFLGSAKDYHVSATFYSTECSFFPLFIKRLENRYYIADSNLAEFFSPEEIFSLDSSISETLAEDCQQVLKCLKAGDELIAINGCPTEEVVRRIIATRFGGDDSETGYAIASQSLFQKLGRRGDVIPKGLFTITVQHQSVDVPVTYTLPWLHRPEKVMNKSKTGKNSRPISQREQAISRYLKKEFKVHYAEELFELKKDFRKTRAINIKDERLEVFDEREKGFLPPLGKILWETRGDQELYAYLYQHPNGKKIGYIYLPTFSFFEDADWVIDDLISILDRFERQSAALVFDITNNPGGNLFFTYAVLSLLTNKPLDALTERQILIQKDVYEAWSLYEWIQFLKENPELLEDEFTLAGYPCSGDIDQKIMDYCLKIVQNWEEGKTLTDPLHIYGVDQVMPHPKFNYSKPILVLVNECDFSCGDLFPAILQDNKRAVLFGKKTAGAGGGISFYTQPSCFGLMQYTLTNSLVYRTNGALLENLGVTPDVPYEITHRDLIGGYGDYINAVNEELMKFPLGPMPIMLR